MRRKEDWFGGENQNDTIGVTYDRLDIRKRNRAEVTTSVSGTPDFIPDKDVICPSLFLPPSHTLTKTKVVHRTSFRTRTVTSRGPACKLLTSKNPSALRDRKEQPRHNCNFLAWSSEHGSEGQT